MGLKVIDDMHDVVIAEIGDFGGTAYLRTLKDEYVGNNATANQPSAWRSLIRIEFPEQGLYLRQTHFTDDLVALYDADQPGFTEFLDLHDLLGAPDEEVRQRLDIFRRSNDTHDNMVRDARLIALYEQNDENKPVGLIALIGGEATRTVAAKAYAGPEFSDREQIQYAIRSTLMAAYQQFDDMAVAGVLELGAGNMRLIPNMP